MAVGDIKINRDAATTGPEENPMSSIMKADCRLRSLLPEGLKTLTE